MIVILIFVASAAVCINLFVKAFEFSTDSEDLTKAVLKAESAVESFKATPEDVKESTIYYDKDWNETDGEKKARYSLSIVPEKDGDLYTCHVIAYRNTKTLYELTAKRCIS
jgi:hypothetical protein